MAKKYKKTLKEKRAEAEHIMNSDQLKKCHAIIHKASAAAATSGAIPIPVADALPISAAQVIMAVGLGKVFDQKITEASAKGLIGAAASTLVGRSLVKVIPFVGWVISASVAAGVTEATGWTIAVDFAKIAKLNWQASHNDNTDTTNKAQPQETVDERNEIAKIIADLKLRSQPFLKKEKTATANGEEYTKLILDFEKVNDYIDEELKEMYDKLVDLPLES